MNLIELIDKVGMENINVQPLNGSITRSVDKVKRKCTEISFETQELTTTEIFQGRSNKIGLILWIPADKIPK